MVLPLVYLTALLPVAVLVAQAPNRSELERMRSEGRLADAL
jgi:hypothetical protein